MCNTKESNKAYQQRLGTWQVKTLTKTNHETLTQNPNPNASPLPLP